MFFDFRPIAPLIEVILITLVSLLFVSQTSRRRGKPMRAVSGHFLILWAFWFTLMALRIALYKILPVNLALPLTVVLTSAALLPIMLFQLGNIAALRMWGQWLTWLLVRTYLKQLGWLDQVLGVRRVHQYLIGALVLVLVMLLSSALLLSLEWAHRASGFWIAALLSMAAVFSGIWWQRRGVSSDEPLAYFFNRWQAQTTETAPCGYAQDSTLEAQVQSDRTSYRANRAASQGTNVIVIVVDALREDHLCAYGYQRATSTNLSQLIKRHGGTVVSGMRAAGPNSFVGLLALARSKHADQFNAYDLSLPEVLHQHGYQRHFLLSGDHTNFYGLKQALGASEVYQDGTHWPQFYVNDDSMLLAALETLPSASGSNYLQMHLMSAHAAGVRLPGARFYTPWVHPMRAPKQIPARAHSHVINFYDNGIRCADQILAQAIETLDAKGYLHDALVVVTADHGEALGECDIYGHGQDLNESGLRIPCVFLRFGGEKLTQMNPPPICSQIDIAPTILRELNLPIPENWLGHPLQTGRMHALLPIHNNQLIGCYDLSVPGFIHKYWRNFNQPNSEHYSYATMAQTAGWASTLDCNQIENQQSTQLFSARLWAEKMHAYKQRTGCAL